MSKRINRAGTTPRERLLAAAYDLFAAHGVNRVGIDTVLARAECAKASLYGNFPSKTDLAIAFLDRRGQVWTRDWLESEVKRRAQDPEGRLLAFFDVLDGWFRRKDFEGCSFVKALLESEPGSRIRVAAAAHLAKMRKILGGLAKEAGLRDADRLAQTWHMLIKGSIVSAGEGHRDAALDAKRAAELILNGWPRR